MYRFEKLIVNLALDDGDIPVLKMASQIAKLACSDSVIFIYAREPVEIPASLKKQYPWMMEPIGQAAEARARAYIETHFKQPQGCETKVIIEEKTPIVAILERAVEDKSDLILTGGEGEFRTLAIKAARKAPCSVMYVPSNSSGKFSQVYVGIDLSRFSEYTIDIGTAFASAQGIPELSCASFYEIPAGYHKTNMPRSFFEKDLKDNTENSLNRFLSEQNLRGVRVNRIIDENPFPGATLARKAENEGYDLVIVGCRGKGALTATLLGSNAEDALRGVKKAAVLAVKEKGTGTSFVEALLGLKSAGNLF